MTMALFDYTSMGFYTFDALCRPVTAIPPNGDTYFVEDFAIAVSGAAGSAAIAAAKHGLKVQAVGGIGNDDMGDWVKLKLSAYGIDTELMQRRAGFSTSSSIVTTRPDGARPALHKKGATGDFFIGDAEVDRVLDTTILHVGGVGLMDRMDQGRTLDIMAEAKRRGITTTLDVFAATKDDFQKVKPLLAYTDYFLPSEEEARALSGLDDLTKVSDFLLENGAGCVVLTLGREGAFYQDRSGFAFHMPSFDIDVVCTCGCGDCFNAGIATGLHLGLPPRDMVRLAQACSAQNATGLGSQAGIVDYAGTLRFIDETPHRSVANATKIRTTAQR
jgi:sugar/nucleoside kinase (ribokinase family)